MKYRRKYTLFTLKNRKGKPVWYFRIYLPDGTRRSKTTGCNSREKAMRYVKELLEDETMLRKVFESDLVVAIDSSHSLIQTTIRETPKSSITFEEFASPWWHCIGEPTIKGKIIGGIAKDVSICYDTSPNGLDRLPPEAAMAYAHRIISTAYFAKWVEGMPVIEPEKEDLAED